MKSFSSKLKAFTGLALAMVATGTASAANNIILFIGDGMGPGQVKAGRAFVHGSTSTLLDFEALGFTGAAVTTLPNGTVTDSATAGTALATGYQHNANGVISMGANNSIKTTILELAKAKGYLTGIITTDDIGGATPGAFGAHEPDRTLMADIRYDYLLDDVTYNHKASLPDVLLGGGYNDPAFIAGTGKTYVAVAQSLGYSFAGTSSDLDRAPGGRVLGLFGSGWAPMTVMAARAVGSTQPTLSEMVTKALSVAVGAGSPGFFLMVESANIDKLCHSNNPNFVYEVAELERAVALASSMNLADTLIMVTADHETGGLSVPDQTGNSGTLPTMTFSSTGHSAANVPVYSTWPSTLSGQTIDNTEVFFIAEDFLNLPAGKPPVITGLAVSGVTETSATVQWTTTEPSGSYIDAIENGTSLTFGSPAPTTAHSVTCTGLLPGTTYTFTARSADLSGFVGTLSGNFVTKIGSLDAVVTGEPKVTRGSVAGSYLGVLSPNDSSTQNFNETPYFDGASLMVEFELRTSAPTEQIGSITLQGNMSWTQRDGAKDDLVIEVATGAAWETIQLPFTILNVPGYLSDGSIRVRFSDTYPPFRRERKDTLSVDYLVGTVMTAVSGQLNEPAKLEAVALNASSVQLTWADIDNENGYTILRRVGEDSTVFTEIANFPAGTTEFTDTSVAPTTTYTYGVQACNAQGCSAVTTSQAVTTPLAAPKNLTASIGKGVVYFSWTDTNDSEAGFHLLQGDSPDCDGEAFVLPSNSTNFSLQVPRGVTYYYQVRAVKENEWGPPSNTVSAKAR